MKTIGNKLYMFRNKNSNYRETYELGAHKASDFSKTGVAGSDSAGGIIVSARLLCCPVY
jgi:hypothetical protein